MERKNLLGNLVFAALLLLAALSVASVLTQKSVRVKWTSWPKGWGQVKLYSPEPGVGSATFEVWSFSEVDGYRRLGEYTIDVLSGPGGRINTAWWDHPTACGVTASVKLTRYPGWGSKYAFGCVVDPPTGTATTTIPN